MGLIAAAFQVVIVPKILGMTHVVAPVRALAALVLLQIVFIIVANSGTIRTIGHLAQERN